MTIQAIEQYFPVVLFIMLYKVVRSPFEWRKFQSVITQTEKLTVEKFFFSSVLQQVLFIVLNLTRCFKFLSLSCKYCFIGLSIKSY